MFRFSGRIVVGRTIPFTIQSEFGLYVSEIFTQVFKHLKTPTIKKSPEIPGPLIFGGGETHSELLM